jgi:hypothetical protein
LVFAKVEPGRVWSLGRIDPNGRLISPRQMDTRSLLALAAAADLRGRVWSGLAGGGLMTGGAAGTGGQTDQTDGTDQTGGAEGGRDTVPIPGVAVGATVPIAPVVGVEASAIPPAEGDDQAGLPSDPQARPSAPDHVYDELIGRGLSRAEGAQALHHMGYGMDTNRWRDRRQALGVGRTSRVNKRSRAGP